MGDPTVGQLLYYDRTTRLREGLKTSRTTSVLRDLIREWRFVLLMWANRDYRKEVK